MGGNGRQGAQAEDKLTGKGSRVRVRRWDHPADQLSSAGLGTTPSVTMRLSSTGKARKIRTKSNF